MIPNALEDTIRLAGGSPSQPARIRAGFPRLQAVGCLQPSFKLHELPLVLR